MLFEKCPDHQMKRYQPGQEEHIYDARWSSVGVLGRFDHGKTGGLRLAEIASIHVPVELKEVIPLFRFRLSRSFFLSSWRTGLWPIGPRLRMLGLR